MTKIFISYRNSDSSVWAGRIYDSIKNKFGHGSVFKADRDSNIDYGKKFPEVLRTSVLNCVVCIVCIGKSWLDTLNKRKSSKDVDWVKEEIRLALKNKKVIIPILLDGAEMPSKGDLPRGLKSLYDNQGLKITNDSTFHQDIDNLIKSLENHLHSVNNVINDIYQLIDQFTEAYQSKDYEPQQSLDILYRIQSRDDIPSYFDINDYQNELEKIKDNLEKERLTEQQYGTIIKALHSGSPVNKIVDGFKDFWRINPDYDPQNYKITHSGIIYNILPQPFEWVYLGTRRIIVHSKSKIGYDIPDKFLLSNQTITNSQFEVFIKDNGYKEKNWWTEQGWAIKEEKNWVKPRYWVDNNPNKAVIGISFHEATAFCNWLSNLTSTKIIIPYKEMWFTERSNGVIKWQENVDSKEYLARYDRLDWQEYHYHKSVDADPKIWEWCQNLPAENSIVQLENRFNGKQVTFRNYDSFESENISFRIATLIVD